MATVPTHSALENEPYEISNLFPRITGLPKTIRVRPKGGAGHDARVEVAAEGGNRVVPETMAVMGIRPEPRLIEGRLDGWNLALASEWITLNGEALVAVRDRTNSGTELGQRLQMIR